MIETPAGATKVLVVDDEPSITDLVSMALRYEQFDVRVAGNGREALDAVESFSPDLAVLDIMMPGIDGFEVARRLRNQGVRLPILFLTARDATEDKVRGLTLGGDDYMTKPFSVEELVARIRAILRRVQPAAAEQSRLAFADLELDEDTHEVWRAGREIELTATEFKLLRYLMLNAAPRTEQGPDPRPRLELRLRRQRQHRRDLRELPASQGRRRRRAAHPHGARRRLQPPRAQGVKAAS